MRTNLYILAILIFLTIFSGCSKAHTISVSNDSDFPRENEIVELNLENIPNMNISQSFRLIDEKNMEIPYQLTYDNKLIFPVSLKHRETINIKIEEGQPSVFDTIACGSFYPQRKDDLTWENDRSAYRAYGPALQASGEKAYGYDIWTKSVATPVVAKRYHEALDLHKPYHEDRGEGMDVYTVGPTLGAGATALIDSTGNIVFPWAFKEYRILDNGPLRFTASLNYDGGESRLISLDAGEYLNRTTVSYPKAETKRVASGIVVHRQNPDGYVLNPDKGFMAYADLTDNSNAGNGVIFVGIVSEETDSMALLPFKEPIGDAIGHILALKDYNPGDDFTYYWGSGWSKGSMADWDSWINYLQNFKNRLDKPLSVSIK